MPKRKLKTHTFTLAEYVAEHGQTQAGADIGVSQAAISQMLRRQRDIYVEVTGDAVSAHERKPIGRAA